MRTLFSKAAVPLFLAAALAAPGAGAAPAPGDIAADAYVFAYPLVLMDVTKRVMTATRAPINQFQHMRAFPTPADTDVVSPNADTLYSTAWLDLGREPLVLSIPDTKGRYYLMPMLDAWTNVFASPGARTTGTGKQHIAIVGPGWSGRLPEGVTKVEAPTSMVWIIGRILCRGPSDYAAVHELQDQLKLTPLSAWGTDYEPPAQVPVDPSVDTTTAPVDQVARMDAEAFFTRFGSLLRDNPPAAADAAMMAELERVGITRQRGFEPSSLAPATLAALRAGAKAGLERLVAAGRDPGGRQVNGWHLIYDLGSYGTNYLRRASVAWVGLGANLPQDAIYPMTRVDGDGRALSGAHRYVLHFAADELPPVHAFWSVTMYDERQFFVPNPIDRYAIGDRNDLRYNDDGSLDLYVQHESPGADKESNWLPAPAAGAFNLILRLYWPKEQVLSQVWAPPPVKRVE